MSICSSLFGVARPFDSATPARRPLRCVGCWLIVCVAAVSVISAIGDGMVAAASAPAPGATIGATAAVDGMVPAVRLTVPVSTVPVTSSPMPVSMDAAPVENVSSCRTDMPGSVATMTIPSISYECPLYSGTQATIDAGAATWVSQPASVTTLATHVGGPGTIWLAGHRTSHGGSFAAMPDLVDGAVVTLTDATGTASYRIVGRAYVHVSGGLVQNSSGMPSEAATLDALLRTDRGGSLQPRLVIQTCDGVNYRWMIYADLIVG